MKSRRGTTTFLAVILLLSFASSALPKVSAVSGNEAVSLSNMTEVNGTVVFTNLDPTDKYSWYISFKNATGSYAGGESGLIFTPSTTTVTRWAEWSPMKAAGTYYANVSLSTYGAMGSGTLLDTFNYSWVSNGSGPNLSQDYYEPNNSDTVAYAINANQSMNHSTNIHNWSEDDWFEYQMVKDMTVWINITFLHVNGDLQLNTYRVASNGNKVSTGYTHSENDHERIMFNTTTNATYLIWVFSSAGANNYTLTVEAEPQGPPPTISGDQFEPNEDDGNATWSTLTWNPSGLNIHNSSDEDWFAVNLTSGIVYHFNVTFVDSQGDIDTALWNAAGVKIKQGSSSTSDEKFSWNCTATAAYYFQVDGWNGATNGYGIFIEEEGGIRLTGTLASSLTNISEGLLTSTQLLSGQEYTLHSSFSLKNGSSHINFSTDSEVWTTDGTFTEDAYTVDTEDKGGWFCLRGWLYDSTDSPMTLMDSDESCLRHMIVDITATGTNSAIIGGSNLSASVYSLDWSLIDSSGATHESGTLTPSVSSNSFSETIQWSNPTDRGEHCINIALKDSSGDFLEGDVECIQPHLPEITSLSLTDSSVDFSLTNLTSGTAYLHESQIYWQANETVAKESNNLSYFAQSSSASRSWNFDGPPQSGNYCARVMLYTQQGEIIDNLSDICRMIINDGDDDGVADENDDCPNTPTGEPVDPNGCASSQTDSDGDGWSDSNDEWPNDPSQWVDSDGDGHGDNSSGTNGDAFPDDSSEWSDSDGDGCGDNSDAFPEDSNECIDSDGDGVGDNTDIFPNTVSQWADADGDGCGDNPDGISGDQFPEDATQCIDADGDGHGDNLSGNNPDELPENPTQWMDIDGDGYGDNLNGSDADRYPIDPTQWFDRDGDGYGDNLDGTNPDSCPDTPPMSVVDGNGCSADERDSDGDGVNDNADLCPSTPSGETPNIYGCGASQLDNDGDGIPNVSDDCALTALGARVDEYGCSAAQGAVFPNDGADNGSTNSSDDGGDDTDSGNQVSDSSSSGGEGFWSGVILTFSIVIVLLALGGAVAVVTLRGKGDVADFEDDEFEGHETIGQAIHSEESANEQRWQDSNGVNWCRMEDGTYRWDGNQWIRQ